MGIKVHTSAGTFMARQFTVTTWRVTNEATGDVVGTVTRVMVPDMAYTGTGTATVAEWNGQDTLWRAVRDIVASVTGSRVMTYKVDRDDVVTEVTERREAMSGEASRFIAQNATAAQTLTVDEIEAHADHHAGGLIVLWRSLSDDWSVKMHDSWGGPDERGNDVVVHVYRNGEEDPRDSVTYYATGREAFAAYMATEAPADVPTSDVAPQRFADIVHDVILDGFADRSEGSLSEGDPIVVDLVDFTDPATADQAGVTPGAYVREANDYGQHVTYRFATREAADAWIDAVSADFPNRD